MSKALTGAADSLFNFMLQRSQERQQQLIDGITLNSRVQQEARAQQEAKRQAQRDAQIDADRLATIHGPDASLDATTAASLRAGGYRIDERTTLPARVIAAPVAPGVNMPARDLPSIPYSQRAETFAESLARQAREQQQAERDEARQFRHDEAASQRAFQSQQTAANRQAAEERANADREMKMLIAQMSASNNLETRALGNELKRLQVTAAQDKLDAAHTDRDRKADDARQTTQFALTQAERLLQHPGIGAATGAYEMRGWTQSAQDFSAVRDQLIASLTQPHLGALKGPMSDKDVAFVKSLATRLQNPKLSEGETKRAINEAVGFLRSKLADSGAGGGGNGRDLGAGW